MKTLIGIIFFVSFLSFHQLGVYSLDSGIALKPNYTSINLNVSYKSIGGLEEPHSWFVERYYEFVNVIVDFILPDALPNELLNIGLGDVLFMNYGKLLWAYRRLMIFVIIVLIQIFFLIGSNVKMLCSCLFFCTRWCNWKPPETPSNFRKWLWLVWVYTALALLLFMLVMAHQSNQNMDDGIGNVVVTLDDTIVDVELFVDTTLKQLEILLLNNLQDYLTFFINSGEKTTMEVLRDLEGILGAIDFSQIFEDIEENFNFIKPIFDEIEKVIGEVEDLGKTINKDIAGLKNMVENLICETAECEQLKKLIPSLESVYDGGSYLINGTFTDLENLAGLGEKELEGLGNLTYLIGGKAIEEGKALDNLTAKIAGNIVTNLEIAGGGLANMTSAIGSKAIEEGKALDNLTAKIAGNVVADLKIAGGGLANMTSAIGSKAIEEGKALDNLTAKIAGNIVTNLEIAGGGLANMTSAIGSKAIEEGKALDNLTAKIAGNVVADLEIAGGGLANMTSAIGSKAIEEGKALDNLTAKVTGKVIEGLKDTGKGLTNLTKNIVDGLGNVAGGVGNEIKNEGKALKDLTKNVAGGIAGGIGDVAGGLKDEVGGLFGGLSKWTFGSGQKKEKKGKNPTTEASKVVKTPTANATENIVIKGLEKTGKGLTNLPKNIVGGLGNVAGGIGGEIKNEGKALKDLTGNVAGGVASGIGNVAGGIKNEVGGLLSWTFGSGDKKKKSKDIKSTNGTSKQEDKNVTTKSPTGEGKSIENTTPKVSENVIIKDLKDTGKGLTNLTGNIVGGLENMAGGVENQLKNEGKALKDLTGNVAGGVASGLGNVAGGIKNEVGGLLSWTFGSGDKKKKSKDTKPTNGTSKQEDKTVTTKSPIGEGESIELTKPKVSENVIIKDLKDTGKGGIKNEVGGLLSWTFGSGDKTKKSKDIKFTNGNSKKEDKTVTTKSPIGEGKSIDQTTPKVGENVIIKDLKDTGKGLTNLTGNIVGGLENMAGGVGNQLRNEEKALKDLTGNVAGGVATGIGNVAGGIKNEVGGLLSWTFGSGDKKKKSNDIKSTNGTSKQEEKTVTTKSPIGEGKSIEPTTPKVNENVIIKDFKDTGKGLTNLTGNIVGGLENMAGGVGNQLKNEGKALKDLTGNAAGGVATGIGNVAGGIKNEVGGLLSWTFGSKEKKNKAEDKKPSNTTQMINKEKTSTEKSIAVTESAVMTTGKGSSSLPGKIVGGLENIAGGVGNELKNEGKALKDLTGNIAGGVTSGIGNVAGGIESEVGGLFKGLGGWTFGSGDKKEKPKPIEPIKTSKVTTEANIVTTNKVIQEKEKSIITHVLTSSDNLVPKQVDQIDESSMDLTLDLKNIGNVNTGQTNSFNNIFAGLGNLASKVETGVQTSGNAITGKIGNTASGVKSEVSNIFGGLGTWSSNKKIKDVTIAPPTTAKIDIPTTPKLVKTKSQSGFGSFFGGIENLASGVTSGIKKGGSKLEGLASNVVGGVENTAGGVESKIGGLFGGWSSGGSSKTTIVTTVKPNVKTTTPKKVSSGFGGWFGGSSTSSKASKVSSGIEKTATGVENKVSGASKKLLNMGDSFFGFRRKRALGLSFSDLKKDFNMIFGTIDRIENYVVNDLKHLNNITYIISPIIDEIDSILKTVLHEVEGELKEATKPLEKFFAATIDKIISVENSILNATHIIQGTQELINWYEIYRYHISNFIAGALLLSFTVLTFGISVRMKCNNTITKFTYKGGFTFLHITALLMAVTSLIYIVIGVTSQKVLCETLDTNYREDNIMRLLSRINPAKYGLLLDINLHKVILRCHQDQSIYEVTALKSVMNIEKLALEFFDLDAIEKEFEPLFNMTMDFSKYLPLGTIHTIEEDLGFESFEKILDFPIFAQMEKLEEEFTHIPIIGPVIKALAGKIVSFKDKIQSIQSPVQSANLGFPNLLSNIKKLLTDVENQLVEIEERSEKTLEDVATNFKNILLTSLKDYVYNRLIHSIEHEIGKCKPISAAFNSTLNSVCRRITTPANGHWFSWFTGVFLSIFLIVLSRYVDDKINRFKEGEKTDSPDESSKPVDEIEMKSFENQKVEINCEKTVTQSEEAL